jgi:hypothetical protein
VTYALDQPQTSCATWTIRRSFATCSSCVMALPSTVEEKPHCGDRQSCSSGTYFAASSMRRLRSSGFSSLPVLVEPARALVVELAEEAVDVEFAEQRLGHEVVAALRRPGRAEVAPAHVRGDLHVGRAPRDGRVDLLDVAQVLVVGVLALGGHLRPLRGVVEVREAGVVQLEVAAAEIGERAHLVGVGRGEVRPELLDVRVDALVDRRRAAAVVDHARRRDRQLRDGVGGLLREEAVGVGEDRLLESHLPGDGESGRGERPLALRVDHPHTDLLVGLRDAAELVDEVHVPRRAAVLAVGGRLQADLLLHGHGVADGVVLDLAQPVGVQGAGGEALPRLEQGLGAEQAPDVVGAERRLTTSMHGRQCIAEMTFPGA